METICEDIRDDMKNIESDAKKIDCYAPEKLTLMQAIKIIDFRMKN